MVRFILFALVSVALENDATFQILLGLALLFGSALAHVVFQPFASPQLNAMEGAALVASWFTLYCGTLLSSRSLLHSSGVVKTLIEVCTVAIQVAYVGWSVVELRRDGNQIVRSPNGEKGAQGGSDDVELTNRTHHGVLAISANISEQPSITGERNARGHPNTAWHSNPMTHCRVKN